MLPSDDTNDVLCLLGWTPMRSCIAGELDVCTPTLTLPRVMSSQQEAIFAFDNLVEDPSTMNPTWCCIFSCYTYFRVTVVFRWLLEGSRNDGNTSDPAIFCAGRHDRDHRYDSRSCQYIPSTAPLNRASSFVCLRNEEKTRPRLVSQKERTQFARYITVCPTPISGNAGQAGLMGLHPRCSNAQSSLSM